MRRKSELTDHELFRTAVDNLRCADRAERFGMPEAAEHWRREYDACNDEHNRRDKERYG